MPDAYKYAKHIGNLLNRNRKVNVAETKSSKRPLQDIQKVKNELFEDGVYTIVAFFWGRTWFLC
jgi:hypothetical protein